LLLSCRQKGDDGTIHGKKKSYGKASALIA
jgi:hypothetical protein